MNALSETVIPSSSKIDLVILIKGTWTDDEKPNWTSEGSEFRNGLDRAGFKNVESPKTYFGNNASQRARAAEAITEYINGKNGDLNILVLAHSHGGNAMLKALPQIRQRGGSIQVVSLSTPFIKAYTNKTYFNQTQLAISVFLLLMFLTIPIWNSKLKGFSSFAVLALVLWTAFSLVKIFINPSTADNDAPSDRATNAVSLVNYPRVPSNIRMLIIRGVGDEAAAAIGLSLFTSVAYRWSLIAVAINAKKLLLACIIAGYVLVFLRNPQDLTELLVGGLMTGLGLAMIMYSSLSALTIVTVFANAGFAFDLAIGLSQCEFDVSTVPEGDNFTVVTLGPVNARQYPSSREMRHAIYNHPACVNTLVDWLKDQKIR